MNRLSSHIVLAAILLPFSAHGGEWTALKGKYKIHSGGTAYSELPTKADSALTVYVQGKVAKEIFDQIGPDKRDKCSSEVRDRERRKKGVECTYTAHLAHPKALHYTCWIGINLRSGEGDVRVSC